MGNLAIYVLVFALCYILFCGLMLYFCFMADAESSEVAYLVQVALPAKIERMVSKIVGKKNMGFIDALRDRFLVFLYLFVVLGCWSVVFSYVYPSITESASVSNVHKYIGGLVFIACFGSWRLASVSSPGFVTAKTFKRYDHYAYDPFLFPPNRRCQSTNLIRIPRSKFDRIKYNRNVPRYDHFCGWVFNTIGEENYRWFLLGEIREKKLLEITFFDRKTGDSVESSWIPRRSLLGCIRISRVCMFLNCCLSRLQCQKVHLTSINQTTNENGKWSDVKRWHKAQKKKYEDAIKSGLIKPEDSTDLLPEAQEAVVDDDGDVTCTGASSATKEKPSEQALEEEYIDPGPVPKNVHDRGFTENWKEVLFPISLRKDALAFGGYSKPPRNTADNPKERKTVPPPRSTAGNPNEKKPVPPSSKRKET
eukprot:scaffold1384_cov116-Cylindrotheca_fusiformis.AAC.45